jgi:hypothetical protein
VQVAGNESPHFTDETLEIGDMLVEMIKADGDSVVIASRHLIRNRTKQ